MRQGDAYIEMACPELRQKEASNYNQQNFSAKILA